MSVPLTRRELRRFVPLLAGIILAAHYLVIGALNATDTAVADTGKSSAIEDFDHRIDLAYAWSRQNPDAFDKWYADFAHLPLDVATQVRPEETSYQRIPLDSALTAQLQKTYDTWVQAGLFPGGHDLSKYIAPRTGTP